MSAACSGLGGAAARARPQRLCLPAESFKSKRDHVVILNDAAWSIVQGQRGLHPIWVFPFRGHRMTGMNNTGWRNARRAVGLGRLRVHDLRHTFACRLRAAGVAAEDRAAMLGHAEHSMSGHYASADVGRLVELANLVLKRHETRTVLRVANGWPVEPAAERLWITGPAAVPQ
jgi:integrase